MSSIRLCWLLLSSAVLIECPASGSQSIARVWDEQILSGIRIDKPNPPVHARNLFHLSVAMYDAWAAYDAVAVGTRLGGSLRRPPAEHTLANKQQAISYAAYRALVDLFPTEGALFDFMMAKLGYDPADSSTDTATPEGIGNLAARAVIQFRHHDGSNQLGDLHPGAYSDYTGYKPVNTPDVIRDPNRWQPLRVPNGLGGYVVQTYVGAQWGRVTPFALTSGSQLRPAAPPLYPSDEYVEEVEQIVQYSADLTDEQKAIAEYWADGPSSELPPGHWCLFAHFVSVRPVTAVHYLFHGKPIKTWGGPYLGTRLIDGKYWKPYQAATVVTPAFPEYISGHSTFSAAAAEVLKRFTGGDRLNASYTQPAGTSPFEPAVLPAADITLSWATFSQAADQAGLSRRYGGIHFEPGDVEGRRVGRLVGAQVWNKGLSYINGST